MSRHDKTCIRCRIYRATYAIQNNKQIRTKPSICTACALDNTKWIGQVHIYNKPEKFIIGPGQTSFLKNYRATEKEIVEIINEEIQIFTASWRYLWYHGGDKVLNHFFSNERKICCFIAKVYFDSKDLLELWDIEYQDQINQVYIDLDKNIQNCKRNICRISADLINEFNNGDPDFIELNRNYSEIVYNHRINNEILYYRDRIKSIFIAMLDPELKIDNKFLTSDVKSLANGIYENQAWDRMPILADALQDAGCDENKIINYCQNGNHFRGCLVLDSILGKN